jgi:hypothetical protein
MIKKLSTLLVLVMILSVAVFAQDRKKNFIPKAPVVLNETNTARVTPISVGNLPAANYVAVDTMQNAFGPAIGALNPLAYDPWANVVALAYRGATTYAAGSGQIWYSISTDKGVSWTRVAGVNTAPIAARYPSMAILNPTKGDINATTGVFSWPELTPAAFGFVGYGADQPLGAGTTFSDTIQSPPAYSSQVPTWTSDNSDHVFWASDNQDDARITLFRTTDFATVDVIEPPQWSDEAFFGGGSITMGGMSHNGVQYYAVLGTMDDPDTLNPIISGWYMGYSKSTDYGDTWTEWNIADFRTIPATAAYDRLWDYEKGDEFVSYQGDIIVDNDGFVHLITGVTDTTTDNNTGRNAIIEVYETATGWDAKVIAELGTESDLTDWSYGTLNQSGYSTFLAKAPEGNVYAAQWAVGSTESNNVVVDLYYSTRSGAAEWTPAVNLTNTLTITEDLSHMAPYMSADGNDNYTFFSGYAYDETGAVPPNDAGRTVFYVTPVQIVVSDVNDTDPSVVKSFELGQNYPNPFNPSTKISYTISEKSNVVLKVFDMLGREVATLVNNTQEAGSYSINFDASKLSSGMYVYSLKSGSFSATKKMMLMK